MDEADGVGAGDRGGLGALLQIIKKTRVPIVLICNDRGDKKITTLLSHSFDIKFAKPSFKEILGRVTQISRIEGFKVDPNRLQEICEASGNDIR